MVSEALPDVALQPVTRHGTACSSTGNGKPESGMAGPVGPRDDGHDLQMQPEATREDPCEVLPATQPPLRTETPIGELVLRQ